MRNTALILPVLMALWLPLEGCDRSTRVEEPEASANRSPSARPDIVEALRQDQEALRHPADGGGRVRFLGEPDPGKVSEPGSWTFVYEAGPLGIAENGWLFFQAPPFWGWSTPQVQVLEGLGFTEVTTPATELWLDPATIDQQLLAIQVQGRALTEGEEITIAYGAGPAGALADRYAESRSCFFFAVDGDGDGIRSLVEPPLCIEVAAGVASRLAMTLPSAARRGQRVRLTVAVLDPVGNRAAGWSGVVRLHGPPDSGLPSELRFQPQHAGAQTVELQLESDGTVRVTGSIGEGIVGESNPMVVDDDASRVLWADLHGHSGLSDGTGTPKDYFRYARDVAGLDVAALTDHDHWGMQPLAIHPELWEEVRRETELFHQPEEFVTLLGYEWTSWIHGHRHVLYFSDQGKVFSSVDPAFESPVQLWDALRGSEALTFAHHSAGGPVATNWAIAPDPELEPVTEIVSVHGSSEALDSPSAIYSPVVGNFVRDVLNQGLQLGFVGSGDGHDGHPGLAHLNAASGGLAAILSEDLTREGVLEALRSRRVYATNGPRILLQVNLAGHQMGETIDARHMNDQSPEEGRLEVVASGPGTLQRMDLIRSGEIVETILCGDSKCSANLMVRDLEAGEYLYVRALQTDGGAAWSSPFFFR